MKSRRISSSLASKAQGGAAVPSPPNCPCRELGLREGFVLCISLDHHFVALLRENAGLDKAQGQPLFGAVRDEIVTVQECPVVDP